MAGFKKLQLLSLAGLASSAQAWSQVRSYDSNNFFDGFMFRDADYFKSIGIPQGDPTDGFVNYVSRGEASDRGLIYTNEQGQVYIGVDTSEVLSTSDQGRAAVRLESRELWTTGQLMIADIAHMPGNQCGVWPALWGWDVAEDPYAEIDIIEGAMHQRLNEISLHTCGACSFYGAGDNNSGRNDCSIGGTESIACEDGTKWGGCGVTAPEAGYGDLFNQAGGGVYATLLGENAVKIWMWNSGNVPADIQNGNPQPDSWGTPFADFQAGSCDVDRYFNSQTITINTDFCGNGVGQDWWNSDSTCSSQASTCEEFVAGNPDAFTDSYWLFNSIKVYQ